ncbi:MAG: Coenzyme F420 hydrogenase/dehydrogenase, beta subunit C-terminal domain [Candidatus Jordarchaeum sp.]|uniref:Coenzyme F420 hydrogenase/dehydrogenase, beta subunit C-terminal domain n=1 Tax=Candidatus Jordarchaeum sp. TaxID=2823881 RepID=UPI00404A1B45
MFNKISEDTLLGNFLRCYVGHATNYETRWRGASGDLISALLAFALQEKIIDGALVTRMNKEKPLEPETIIAKSTHEILEAAGSKYCPSPTNTAVKEILKVDGKYAFVGLPCHIHAIRKMEKNSKKLKNRIVLHLGLLCHYSPTFTGTNVLLKKIGVSKNEVDKLSYRGEGWPGSVLVKMKDGGEKRLPFTEALGVLFSGFFIPWRCTMCFDGASELADLSFGDAWLQETSGDKIGSSLIISRNEIGEGLLQVAKSKRVIRVQEIGRDKVLKMCSRIIAFKKKQIMARLKLLSLIGKNHPEYHTKTLKPSVLSYFKGIFQYVCISLSNNRFVYSFLKYAPFLLLKWLRMFTQTFF